MDVDATAATESELVAHLRAQLAASQARIQHLKQERNALRAAYDRLRIEVELLKRRIYLAKAERVDTRQLELEFKDKLEALDRMAGTLGLSPVQSQGENTPKRRGHSKGGRRDLRDTELEVQRLELTDPLFDQLVADGKAERIGFEESARLAWQRAGLRVLVVARAKYRTTDRDGESVLESTPKPPEALERCMAAPSLLAHVAVAKHCDGLPLARLEQIFAREGAAVDRGTMCRWLDDLGATLGASVVEAMRRDALAHAFCIATDATGLRILPGPRAPGEARRPCRKGHVFVQIADRDHILFNYAERETSAAVSAMFEGFKGYVQADAKSVFDALFRNGTGVEPRTEVGCWSHARRKFCGDR